MKQVDSMIIIYPESQPSSVLVEMGYALALSKKTVIFHKCTLPYILQEAGMNIGHIKTYRYNDFDEIHKKIVSNGMDLFSEKK
jgi:hypothetical protein